MKKLAQSSSNTETDRCFSIGMVLLPEFNSLAANAFIDPFRVANYLHGKSIYEWHFLSLDGQSVTASNAMEYANTSSFVKTSSHFDFIVINASWAPEKFCERNFVNALKHQEKQSATLIALDTGAFVMAYAGLLEGYRCSVHYEHIAAFKELFPSLEVKQSLFVVDRNRLSCSGGVAVVDMALEIIHL